MKTQEIIQLQSHQLSKNLVLSARRDREEVAVEGLPLLLSGQQWGNGLRAEQKATAEELVSRREVQVVPVCQQ